MKALKTKCENEIRSFFGLTLINLMIGALMMAFGISIGITQLLELVESTGIKLVPLILMGVGVIIVIAGMFWLVKIAEILDGVEDIKSSWDDISERADHDQVTEILIQMIAHYRKNQPIIDLMNVFGRIAGVLFLTVGLLSVVYAFVTLQSLGVVFESIGQLIGGVIAIVVGLAGLILSQYFKRYSGVWSSRLQEEQSIREALKQQLESS